MVQGILVQDAVHPLSRLLYIHKAVRKHVSHRSICCGRLVRNGLILTTNNQYNWWDLLMAAV